MHRLSHQTGWTLMEAMIVVAIIGSLSMMTVPMMARYRLVEDTRAHANMIARAINEARSQAMAAGNPTFLLFDDPDNPNAAIPQPQANRFALLVNDLDSNGQLNAGDTARNFQEKDGLANEVTGYGLRPVPPFPNAPLAPEDPIAGSGNPVCAPCVQIGDLNGAATFPRDPTTNAPAIGFNSQGIPVALATPTQWGTGAGAYYVTDNDRNVYAVIVLPLGGLRVRVLSIAQGDWH